MERKRRPPTTLGVPEKITERIHMIRGERVMLDEDLAMLYGFPTKVFNQAVRRDRKRFPDDLAFRATKGAA